MAQAKGDYMENTGKAKHLASYALAYQMLIASVA